MTNEWPIWKNDPLTSAKISLFMNDGNAHKRRKKWADMRKILSSSVGKREAKIRPMITQIRVVGHSAAITVQHSYYPCNIARCLFVPNLFPT